MDNPWDNAWDESNSRKQHSAAPSSSATTKSIFSSSTWKDPTEDETDIALPSWSSGPAVTWNEPSDDAPSLWASSDSKPIPEPLTLTSPKSVGWEIPSSSYESMSVHFGGSSAGVETDADEAEVGYQEIRPSPLPDSAALESQDEDGDEEKESRSPSSSPEPEEESAIVDPWTPSRSTFTKSTSINATLASRLSVSPPAPASPDAFEFGTFESGLSGTPDNVPSSDAWAPSASVTAESEWGGAWGGDSETGKEGEEEALDEWEAARREKEKLDRAVPPELLASILQTLEDISTELWPPPEQTKPKATKDSERNASESANTTNNDDVDATAHGEAKDGATEEVGKEEEMKKEEHEEDENVEEEEENEKEEEELKEANEEKEAEELLEPKADSSESRELEPINADQAWRETAKPEDSFNHWKGGMDAIDGLSSLSETLTPPLPPLSSLPAPFVPSLSSQSQSTQSSSQAQSIVSKRSSEAIRLTRSTLISSSGPLGIYLKTKGSIAWEVSVKARPEKTSEEEREEAVPLGWRILPKEEEEKKVEVPEMKRKGTGLLSFFGRRASTPPVEGKEAAKEASPRPSFSSPRVSVDSAGSKVDAKPESPSSSIASPPAPLVPVVPSTSVSAPIAPASAASPSTYGDGGPPDLFQEPAAVPAPSAVSRFFNRFSRTRPSIGHSRRDSKNSLALSTDDLEFLEDIVPSASDKDEQDIKVGNDLTGLQNMIDSAPLPAPLMPPPRIPQLPQSSSQRSPIEDIVGHRNGLSTDALKPNLTPLNLANTSQRQILTPTPALPSQIQTTITQNPSSTSSVSRTSTPSSFASPLSRSSSPGLDMLTIAGSGIGAGGRAMSTSTGMGTQGGMGAATTSGSGLSRPSSSFTNTRSSNANSTMKRPTPVAIMSGSSASSSKSSLNSFSFLPPPPSIRQSSASLLIDDEPTRVAPTSSTSPVVPPPIIAPPPLPSDGFDDDDFSDFHSGAPASANHLFSISSAQPLFSAGSGAFTTMGSGGHPSAFSASSAASGGYGGPRIKDSLNSSVSSAASANSTSTMLLPISGEMDLFNDFPAGFNSVASPAPHEMLRTPSPPALPAKSPGKAPMRASGSNGTMGSVGKETTKAKTAEKTGLGGRVPPGRLNLPPPVSASAYAKHIPSLGHGPSPLLASAGNSAAPFVSPSADVSTPSTSSPSSPKVHQRKVSKEAHQRTRSLVESAATKSGMWPSPAPSAVPVSGGYGSVPGSGYGAYGFGTAPPLTPLPPILSPPPEGSHAKEPDLFGNDLNGDDDDDDVPLASLASGSAFGSLPGTGVHSAVGAFGAQQARAQALRSEAASLNASRSSTPSRKGTLPPLPLPAPGSTSGPTSTQSPALLMDLNLFSAGPSNGVAAQSEPAQTSSTSSKGLSAQDLSFFEGL